jgi:uncharacterized membrane protein
MDKVKIHPRHKLHQPSTFGGRTADQVAGAMGSWKFIIIQTAIVIIWITGNVLGVLKHWDAYPFILLNLMFSTQSAYAAPIILMSQNRAASKDRERDNLEASEVDELLQMNHRQLEILEILHELRDDKKVNPKTSTRANPLTNPRHQ